MTASPLLDDPLDEARLDRQLGGGQEECFPGKLDRDAVELEHDAAGRDPAGPEFRGALTFAHANLGRLLRDRDIRKNPDPNAAGTAHMTCQGAARGLDLARGNPLGFERLEAELAEIQFEPGLRGATYAALKSFPEFCSLWLQHDSNSQSSHPSVRRHRVRAAAALRRCRNDPV